MDYEKIWVAQADAYNEELVRDGSDHESCKAAAVAVLRQHFEPTGDAGELVGQLERWAKFGYGVEASATMRQAAARITALSAEVERLTDILSLADEAYWGMVQTELAASAVGVDLAKQIMTKGYGLNLKLAMKDAQAALGAKP